MKRQLKSIKDVIMNASSFALHDLEEVARLQNAAHADINAFVLASYRKIYHEISTGLRAIYSHIKVSPMEEKVAFDSFGLNGIKDILPILNRPDGKKSIAEISAQIGHDKFNNSDEIKHCFVNPITNLPSFVRGVKNFSCEVAIGFMSENKYKLEEFYTYHPSVTEMLEFRQKEGFALINGYKLAKRNLNSLGNAVFTIVLNGIHNLSKLPKVLLNTQHAIFNDNLSSAVTDLLANKVDFLVYAGDINLDLPIVQMCQSLGFEIVQTTTKAGNIVIICAQHNARLIKNLS